jgi:hypothetical protein
MVVTMVVVTMVVVVMITCSTLAAHIIPAPMRSTGTARFPIPSGICHLNLCRQGLLVKRNRMAFGASMGRRNEPQTHHETDCHSRDPQTIQYLFHIVFI